MAKIPDGYMRMEGSERKPAPGAQIVGPANSKEKISVTILLRRRPDGSPMPSVDSFRIGPAHRGGRIPSDEFAAKYGASPEDLGRAKDFVESRGLTVVETSAARRTLLVSGTVAQMSAAFAVDFNLYDAPLRARDRAGRGKAANGRQTYRGRDGFIYLPNELEGIVVGVFGLDNRSITKRNSNGDPPDTTTLTVPQVAQLYNFPNSSAAGQTVAIFSEAGYVLSDIQEYFSSLGYAAPEVIDVPVNANNDGSTDPETTQDICISGSVARGARIAVYFTTQDQPGWVNLIGRVANPDPDDPECWVLSSSFYLSNGDDQATLQNDGLSTNFVNAVDQALQDAAVQGVTVCIASGDTGTDSMVGDGKAHVQFPGSDPWVLCCGGTTLGDVDGISFEEYVWNDDTGATGGGVSDFFALPSYQDGAGVPLSVNDGHAGRGVPDVAANASPNSGYPMFADGQGFVGNGTSASAPLYAGLIAVINAALGEPVGFLNPLLYSLGNTVVRDISAPPGPADNGTNGVTGYPAVPGWNACAGWGVANGAALLDAIMSLLFVTHFVSGVSNT